MKVYAISDLHLSFSSDKPMDIFGKHWEGHWDKIVEDWNRLVKNDDIVLIAGDISWAMTIENAKIDFQEIAKLPGRKVILRGNHDYWWSSYNKVLNMLPENFYAIQNNAIKIDDYIFCGIRGWINISNEDLKNEAVINHDKHLYLREIERLKLSLKDMQKQRTENSKVIGLMHYPPFNVKFENSQFTDLFEEYDIKKVIYGHLHGKECRTKLELEKNGVTYYLTSCDQIENKLVLISE